MPGSSHLLVTTSTYAYLEPRFLAAGPFERGQVERRVTADGRAVLDDDGRWRMPNAMDPDDIRKEADQIFRRMQDGLADVQARLKAAGLRADYALHRRVANEIRRFDWTRRSSCVLGSLVVLARGWNRCVRGGEMDNRFERQVDDIVSGEPHGMDYLDLWEWLEEAAAVVSPLPSVVPPDQTLPFRAPDGFDETACLPPPALAAKRPVGDSHEAAGLMARQDGPRRGPEAS